MRVPRYLPFFGIFLLIVAFSLANWYKSDVRLTSSLDRIRVWGQQRFGPSRQAAPYLPYPHYNSKAWRQSWQGDYVACNGPCDQPFDLHSTDVLHGLVGLPEDYPRPVFGDGKLLDLDMNVCFDSQGRLGPYGFTRPGAGANTEAGHAGSDIDWSKVRWGDLQDSCFTANQGRFASQRPRRLQPSMDLPSDAKDMLPSIDLESTRPHAHPRTALLIRSWTGYNYTTNDLQSIRALVSELSLLSGGEYQVFLFVDVKDHDLNIWTDRHVRQAVLREFVPQELHSMTVLWNENVLADWYPGIGDWQVYWHQFMPLQWFSKMYPEYEYIWNWEVDARAIGNHYHILEQIGHFAKKAPRKYLWERSARLYIPALHGTHDHWLDDTHAQIEKAIAIGNITAVWGPAPFNTSVQQPIGPSSPWTLEEDDFDWGVDEEADLITLLPIWDPTWTKWTYRDKIFNFIPGVRPHFSAENPLDVDFHRKEFAHIARRTYINTVSRFSRTLLHAMHMENRVNRTMVAEMWPATVALQHGLKAVYAPHPIWGGETAPPARFLDAIFNADGNETAQWSARGDSVYNQDREHHFAGTSWFFNAKLPEALYRAWIRSRPEAVGEEDDARNKEPPPENAKATEMQVAKGPPINEHNPFDKWKVAVGGKKMLCLPHMLLHPVKHA